MQASKEKLRELLERSLADLDLCAMLIDGTPVKGRQIIAVIGIDRDGMKHVLGLREGATENATVRRELYVRFSHHAWGLNLRSSMKFENN